MSADVEIRIVSEPHFLCVVRSAVSAFTQRIGFDDESCHQIVLAVDEALTNIVRHGYGGATDRPMWIKLSRHGENGREGVVITIEDECEQVDPSRFVGRSLEDVRPGGLGVNILNTVMDQVRFAAREGGQGMTLTLCRYIRD